MLSLMSVFPWCDVARLLDFYAYAVAFVADVSVSSSA